MKIDEKLEALARRHEALAKEHLDKADGIRMTMQELMAHETGVAKAAMPARLAGAIKLRSGGGSYGRTVQDILKAHNGPISKEELRAELAKAGYATVGSLKGLSALFTSGGIRKTVEGFYVLGEREVGTPARDNGNDEKFSTIVQKILTDHGAPMPLKDLRAKMAAAGFDLRHGVGAMVKYKYIKKTPDGYVVGENVTTPPLPFTAAPTPEPAPPEPANEPASNGNGKPLSKHAKRGKYGQLVQDILRKHGRPMEADDLRAALAAAGLTGNPFAGFGIMTRHGQIKKTAKGYVVGKHSVVGNGSSATA